MITRRTFSSTAAAALLAPDLTKSDSSTKAANTGALPPIPRQSAQAGANSLFIIDWGNGVADVIVTAQPKHGRISVNKDFSVTYQAAHVTVTEDDSFDVLVTYSSQDTAVGTINITKSEMIYEKTYAAGKHYMLRALSIDDNVSIEPSETHRVFYTTKHELGWTTDAIESAEGKRVDGAYLYTQSVYGTESEPFYEDAAATLLKFCQDRGVPFICYVERGFNYENSDLKLSEGPVRNKATPLHPNVITSFGTGIRPRLDNGNFGSGWVQDGFNNNYLYRSVALRGFNAKDRSGHNRLYNFMLDNVYLPDGGTSCQGWQRVCFRNVLIRESRKKTPKRLNENKTWDTRHSKTSGVFCTYGDDIHWEGFAAVRCGFGYGYDYLKQPQYPMPVDNRSHGMYIQGKNEKNEGGNPSFNGILTYCNAHSGAQFRPGVVGSYWLGGENNSDGTVGSRQPASVDLALFLGAGYKVTFEYRTKELSGPFGAVPSNKGVDLNNDQLSFTRTLMAHSIDPNTPDEKPMGDVINIPAAYQTKMGIADYSAKTNNGDIDDQHASFVEGGRDWVVFNRYGQSNQGSVDASIINDITIRKWAASLMGGNPTRDEYLDWLIEEYENDRIRLLRHIRSSVRWGLTARYLTLTERMSAATCNAIAPTHKDGLRWDQAGNWDTDDIPGENHIDDVNLRGLDRFFNYSYAHCGRIKALQGETITLFGGCLEVDEIDGCAFLLEQESGGEQLWLGGKVTNSNVITVNGGRLLNKGLLSGSLNVVAGYEELVFAFADGAASSWTVSSGASVELIGDSLLAGFDGSGGASASLKVDGGGTIKFTAAYGALPQVREFRTGIKGTDAPDIVSSFTCGGTIMVDISNVPSGTYDLVVADRVEGSFSEQVITGGSGSISVIGTKVQVVIG